ncbi:MAG: Mur ligase family protein, partial [Salinispira sp.]
MHIVHPEHDQSGKRVTVMGLGLHGGGAAAARYFADRGAQVTITDLRDEEILRPSLEVLSSDKLRYVLGRHEERDFTHADVIVKNPAVPRNSPYIITALQHGAALETDISIFLSFLCNFSLQGRQGVRGEREPADRHTPELGNVVFIAVTGSKGKSSTSTIIHHILSLEGDRSAAYLGGNITVSPLSFLEDIPQAIAIGKTVYIVLELSSFQIGDLRQVIDSRHAHHELYWPDYAILTTILPDHQDYYHNMENYVRDKLYLFENMPDENIRIIGDAGKWMSLFLRSGESIAAADIKDPKMTDTGKNFRIMGEHLRTNINMAIHLLRIMGIGAEQINRGVENFPGIDHRLQEIGACMGGRMRIINDSAATIPEAC